MTHHTQLCFFCGGHQDLQPYFVLGGEYAGKADHSCKMCLQMIEPNQAAIFEVTDQDPGCNNPEHQPGIWFTGRWTVVLKQYLPTIYNADTAARVAQAGAGTLRWDRYRGHRLDVYMKNILQ